MTAFITLLHKELSSDYGVDFFGCVMAGQTLKEERKAAYEILSLHIEGMLEDGDAIPKPASLDDIIKDLDNQEAVTFLVDIPLSVERVFRINATLPEDIIDRIDQVTKNRSHFLAQAAMEKLAL